MYKDRLEELSIVYWLKDLFSAYPQIKIVNDYPDKDLELPTISVYGGDAYLKPEQLGSRANKSENTWYIDVFATNKAQRDDFASFITKALENKIPVYDYNAGFPPDVSPEHIYSLDITDLVVRPVRIFPELVEKLYYRTTIVFMTIRKGG